MTARLAARLSSKELLEIPVARSALLKFSAGQRAKELFFCAVVEASYMHVIAQRHHVVV